MRQNQILNIIIILAVGLILLLFISPEVVKLIFFTAFSISLIYCIIKLRNTTTLLSGLAYLAGLILSILVMLNLLKYFAENYVWVSIAIAIIMSAVGLAFLVVIGVKAVQWLYHQFKKRNAPIN